MNEHERREAELVASGFPLRTPSQIEERIRAAIAEINEHGFEVLFVTYCEDAATPGLLGYYAGVTDRARRHVKIATRARTRDEIAETLEHEARHVREPEWDCGNRDVFGRGR